MMTAVAPPAGITLPQQALWWLDRGRLAPGPDWTRAHEICQSGEGDPALDLVHGLVHLVEGDVSNARYWFGRSGHGSASSDVPAERRRIGALLDWPAQP